MAMLDTARGDGTVARGCTERVNIKFGADGVPRQYTGVADGAASVETLYQTAVHRAKEFEQADTASQATSCEYIHHDEKD